jgi:hypothetical protein
LIAGQGVTAHALFPFSIVILPTVPPEPKKGKRKTVLFTADTLKQKHLQWGPIITKGIKNKRLLMDSLRKGLQERPIRHSIDKLN